MSTTSITAQSDTQPAQALAPQTERVPAQTGRAEPRRVNRPYSDETYRQITVEQLALTLVRSDSLMVRCAELASIARSDEMGAINAAARVMTANAVVAKALAQLAKVERCSRTIIETIQKPDPENAGLNSIFSSTRISTPEQRDKIRDVLERALLQFLAEQKQDREKQEGLSIGSCI